MKLNFGKRLVLFLHWLLSLIACALVILWCIMPGFTADIIRVINQLLGAGVAEIAGIALAAVYILLSVLTAVFIFSREKKRGERGFITVDSSEAGRTRIAIGAIEQMIRQAVRGVDGIADMKSSIVNGEDSISINTSVAIISGAHVPTVTMNIQRAIRGYIELNCGVAVREVSVSVHTLTSGEEGGKSGRKKGSSAIPQAPVWQPPVDDPQQTPAVSEAEQNTEEPVGESAPAAEAAEETLNNEAAASE